MISLLFAITLLPLVVLGFLDKLNPIILNDLRQCLSKRSQDRSVLCDNKIYPFLVAASSSVIEIYNLYEPEAKAKTPIEAFPGIQSGFLQLVASTMASTSAHPNRAMYGYGKREGKACWCSSTSDVNQFIQAGSQIPLMFYSVGTKGDPEADNWVKSYRIQYSLDGYEWIYYNDSFLFTGNTDRDSEVVNQFEPFIARSIRLVPIDWNTGICLKLEFMVSKIIYDPIPPRSANEILIAAIQSGFNFIASSFYDANYDHTRMQLDFRTNIVSQGYCSGTLDNNQWVIIAANDNVWWHRLSLQGRGDNLQYVANFSIAYTLDGISWINYKNSKLFTGVYDKWSVNTYELEPFFALSIKIFLKNYIVRPCGRFEAYISRT